MRAGGCGTGRGGAGVVSRTGARVVATMCGAGGAGGGAGTLVRTTELVAGTVIELPVMAVLTGAELLVTVVVTAAGPGGLPALAGPEAAIRPR